MHTHTVHCTDCAMQMCLTNFKQAHVCKLNTNVLLHQVKTHNSKMKVRPRQQTRGTHRPQALTSQAWAAECNSASVPLTHKAMQNSSDHVRTCHTSSTCYSNVQWSSHRPILQTYKQPRTASRGDINEHVRTLRPRWKRSLPTTNLATQLTKQYCAPHLVRNM